MDKDIKGRLWLPSFLIIMLFLVQAANDVVAFGVGHKVDAKLTMAVTS